MSLTTPHPVDFPYTRQEQEALATCPWTWKSARRPG